jgi:HNH endonuclease/Helix-turn-helix domain of resolvase
MRPHVTRFEYLQEAIKHPPVNESICMEWPFALLPDGYGYLRSPSGETKAHRLAYTLYYGPLLPGQWCVCHRCDNPKCFRPSHLFLGTKADNVHDSIRKNRWTGHIRYGEVHGMSKVTEAQIREMNALYLSGETKANIAKQFGISRSQLTHYSKRRTWAHLTDLSWDKP